MNAGSMVGVCSITVTLVILCSLRKKSESYELVVFWNKKTKNDENIEDFLKKCVSFAPKR